MKTAVLYHSADYDGIFCREIARKFLPDAELIGWDFADKPIALPDGQIYVLDLPVDRVFGFDFAKTETLLPVFDASNANGRFLDVANWIKDVNGRLIWIDHHKSSIESHPKDIPGYRIDGVAACRLAWQWFAEARKRRDLGFEMPTKKEFVGREVIEPLAVRLAGEYDIWDKRDERTDIFQFGLRSRQLTPENWSELLDDPKYGTGLLDELLRDGEMLQRYQQRNDAGMMGRSFIVEFEGLKFLALTTARCNSLTFASKDKPETGHDAIMGFYYDGKGWTVSMYHAEHRKDLDLSQIAVKHGGGGHRGACGFRAAKLPFIP